MKIINIELEVVKEEGKRDALNYVTKSATVEQRRKYNIGDVFINGAVCLKCKDFIRSTHRHDFNTCSCGAVSVDGGSWEQRIIGEPEDWINIYEEFTNK